MGASPPAGRVCLRPQGHRRGGGAGILAWARKCAILEAVAAKGEVFLGDYDFEVIGPLRVCISREHRFGTDAFLLASFARPKKGAKVCDLCSGCGIVPLLWFRDEKKAPSLAYAVELLPQAVEQMEITRRENALEGRFLPLLRDLRALSEKDIPPASLDLVSCNPPYNPPGAGMPAQSNHRLTARHEVACDLPAIAGTAARLLRFGGRFCLCGRPQRLPGAMEALRSAGLEPKRLRFVQKLAETPPWLFLLEGRKGGRPFLQVEPPLLMENPQGGFTREVLELYGKIDP